MLDELCPVQFIEGINEYAKLNTRESLKLGGFDYSEIAIKYEPKSTYSLKELQIFLEYEAPLEFRFKLTLWTNYKNNPSDIVLSNCEWVAEKEGYHGWQRIALEKAIVVMYGKTYWLSIDLNDKPNITLPMSVTGYECDIRFKYGNNWGDIKAFKTHRAMLRFYGRIVPIIGHIITN